MPLPTHDSRPRFRSVSPLMKVASLAVVLSLGGCEMIGETWDKVILKVFGLTVCEPERESAEWVLKRALDAAVEKDGEKGWEQFQKILHSSEQTPNALRGWYTMGWKRMRRQAKDYLDSDGCFKIVDFKKVMTSRNELAGVDYYVESHKKEMPTPCAVYIDEEKGDKWRIKRCSL